jgi:gluconolactonase
MRQISAGEKSMKSKVVLALAVLLSCSMTAFAQEGGQAAGQGRGRGQGRGEGGQGRPQRETVVATDKVTPEIPGVVKAGTKIEIIEKELRGADGGVGMPDGSLLIAANGGIAKVDVNGNLTTLVDKSEQAAGLALDSKGRIFAAQYSRKVSILYPNDSAETLTDSFDGKPYIRPNDLVVDKKGGIYFTDCYQVGAKRSPDDLPQAVYYIAPKSKKVTRVADDVGRPNGITLSPDEKTLYVNDWDGSYLLTYQVQPDGSLKNRKNFGKYDLKQETDHGLVSGADGLCIDSQSHLYATTPAGVQVFNSKGEHLGNLEAPYDLPPQNCGFAGPDKHYLYVVGRGVVYRIRTEPTGYKGRGK